MTVHTLKSAAATICVLVFLHGASVQASTDQLRADAYFNAIAGGDADTITSFYDDKAEFHWVGGPLAGIYRGKAQIKAVWKRFVDAAGALDYKVIEVTESRNDKITTVTARVDFIGPTNLPVKFVLMYENGKIVKEIWQVEKPTTFAGSEPVAQQPSPESTTATAATMTVQVPPPPPEKVAAAPVEPAALPEDGPPVSLNAVTVAPVAAPPARKPAAPVVAAPIAAAPAAPVAAPEPADDSEGAPPESVKAASVDPVAPPAVRKAAAPVKEKPKAKVAKKVKKKTNSEYDDDDDDDDYYAYEPRYRYRYGYGSPLRFRYGYRYYQD